MLAVVEEEEEVEQEQEEKRVELYDQYGRGGGAKATVCRSLTHWHPALLPSPLGGEVEACRCVLPACWSLSLRRPAAAVYRITVASQRRCLAESLGAIYPLL